MLVFNEVPVTAIYWRNLDFQSQASLDTFHSIFYCYFDKNESAQTVYDPNSIEPKHQKIRTFHRFASYYSVNHHRIWQDLLNFDEDGGSPVQHHDMIEHLKHQLKWRGLMHHQWPRDIQLLEIHLRNVLSIFWYRFHQG